MADENDKGITVETAMEFLKGHGLHVLSDNQIGSIKAEVKSKYEPLLESERAEKTKAAEELKALKNASMSDAEKQEQERKDLLNGYTELKEKYGQLESKHTDTVKAITRKERESAILDLLAPGSEDASLSVRECLHAFGNLEIDNGSLVIVDKATGNKLSTEETKGQIATWFQSKTLLHKRQPGTLNLGVTRPGGAPGTPKKFNPYDPETKAGLEQKLMQPFNNPNFTIGPKKGDD
jgi:hypothetical protein